MPAWVALLYSIVLSPERRVVMSDLREVAEALGLHRPRTLLATGNLIFEAEGTAAGHEARLEAAFAERFGKRVDIIVRPGAGWPALLAGNPFPAASAREPSRVAVRVMRSPLDPSILAVLDPYRSGEERLAVVAGDLWVHFPDGLSASRLSGVITPARAGGPGTFRNYNTVSRIAALLEE